MVAEECSEACLEISLKLQATAQAEDTKKKSVAFICPDADECSTLSCEEIAAEGLCQCPGRASMVAEEFSEACPVLVSPCLAVADGCSKLSCAEIAAKGFCQCPGCEGMVKEECSAACSEEGLKPPPVLVSPCLAVADGCSKLSCAEIA